MPAPRRKSCFNCVKSKRRCDLETPNCSRCKSRGFVCDYGDAPANGENGIATSPLQAGPGAMTNDPLLVDPSRLGKTYESNQTTNISTPDLQLPSLPDGTLSWSDLMTDVDDFIVSDSVWDHPIEERPITEGAIYQARTVFAMKQLKTWPRIFLERGHNAFIHRHLFQEGLSEPLLDAMGVCALYYGKNDENEPLAFQDISRKVQRLVEDHQTWSSPTDQLASLQTLILYNIIRLFDGDIRLRADAELSDPVLATWTEQLKTRIQPLPTGNSPSSQPITTDWHNWIFAESVRRTVLVSFMLRGIYMFLKQGWDDFSGDVNPLTFTAQSALWNAPSQFQWQEACRECPHFTVAIGNWDSVLGDAQGASLDDLGILMLAILKGLDGLRAQLPSGDWVKYGIDWEKRSTKHSKNLIG
jgi:hypothetical protein